MSYTLKTDITLHVNYTSIKKLKKKKRSVLFGAYNVVTISSHLKSAEER